jgi:hypothetical protein
MKKHQLSGFEFTSELKIMNYCHKKKLILFSILL